MKKFYTIILALIIAVFISASAFSQDTYDLQFRLEDDGSVSGFYEVTAQIKANVSGLKIVELRGALNKLQLGQGDTVIYLLFLLLYKIDEIGFFI